MHKATERALTVVTHGRTHWSRSLPPRAGHESRAARPDDPVLVSHGYHRGLGLREFFRGG
jgi:hypothetical protein